MSGEKFLEELAKEIQREENLDIYSHVQLDESSFRHIADFVLSKVIEKIKSHKGRIGEDGSYLTEADCIIDETIHSLLRDLL